MGGHHNSPEIKFYRSSKCTRKNKKIYLHIQMDKSNLKKERNFYIKGINCGKKPKEIGSNKNKIKFH